MSTDTFKLARMKLDLIVARLRASGVDVDKAAPFKTVVDEDGLENHSEDGARLRRHGLQLRWGLSNFGNEIFVDLANFDYVGIESDGAGDVLQVLFREGCYCFDLWKIDEGLDDYPGQMMTFQRCYESRHGSQAVTDEDEIGLAWIEEIAKIFLAHPTT
jgi:hypothetical protein